MPTREQVEAWKAENLAVTRPDEGIFSERPEPFTPTDPDDVEVMPSRSLRLNVAMYQRVKRLAEAEGCTPSDLMRRWIERGLVEDEARGGGRRVTVDVNELMRILAHGSTAA